MREYAESLGIAHTSVYNAIKTGKISKVEWGGKEWINKPEADANWYAKYKIQGDSNPILLQTLAKGAGAPDGERKLDKMAALELASQQEQLYKSLLLKQKYEKEARTLVPREEVNNQLRAVATALRDQLLRIPDRILDELRATTDRTKAFNLLYDEIEKVLVAVSEGELDRIIEKL